MSESPPQAESATGGPQQSRWSIWVIFLILAGVYVLFSLPQASAIKWVTDLDKGLKEASEKNQLALVMFDAKKCLFCKKMNQQVLSKGEVRDLLVEWVPIRIDKDLQPRVARAYTIDTLPTFIIFSPQGKELKRFEGARTVEEFIEIIQSAEKEDQ
ncbi:MAG: thioredoxin family protein [Planctomycetota bacterium]|jgi:thioredoxin-related protein